MKHVYALAILVLLFAPTQANSIGSNKLDINGTLVVQFIGHGSVMFDYNGLIVYVDPASQSGGNYTVLPKADIILITHDHADHWDITTINKVLKTGTKMVYTQACHNTGKYTGATTLMKNGDSIVIDNLPVKAVPAYNVVNTQYHPKGTGNGYILTFGNLRVYVAGDTENIPEMKTFGEIDIAFIPMNLPYTMTPEMAKDAAVMVMPKILYPYHYGSTDTKKLVDLLKDYKDITLRIGPSKITETVTFIEPTKAKSGIAVYPNIADNLLYVHNLNATAIIKIYDVNGKLQLIKQWIASDTSIEVAHLQQGIYFIEISKRDYKETFKFVKQ